MNVATMRKNLAEVRSLASKQTSEEPFWISSVLSCGHTVYDFCASVAFGIHKKRTRKPKIMTQGSTIDEIHME